MTLNIKIFNEFNVELEKIWKSIEKKCSYSPFQSYEWQSHWFNTIGQSQYKLKAHILVFELDNIATDIFPFCIRNQNKIKILEWIGGVNTDYMCPLHTEESIFKLKQYTFKQIWKMIIDHLPSFDLINFEKQPEYNEEQENFFLKFFNKNKSIISRRAIFEESWEKFKNDNIKKKILNDNKRQIKRLTKLGKLSFILAKNEDVKNNLLKTMIKQKSRKYIESGYNMFAKTDFQKLYLNCKNDLGLFGKIHVSALLLDDKILATHWGFYSKTTFYYIMPSYEGGDWSKFSPGKILLEYLMKWSVSNGLKVFDFTEGDMFYKKNWSNKNVYLYESIIANSFKGYIYIMFYNLKKLLRNINFINNLYKRSNKILKEIKN